MKQKRLWTILLAALLLLGCAGTKNTESAAVEPTPASAGYRLIVNGTEVPVDSTYRESAKGEVYGMLPIAALFRGIGCETEVKGDTVEIRRDGALWLILDLKEETLTDAYDSWYNYFTIAPGGTDRDFKRQRSGDELWVNKLYAGNAFVLLGMPLRVAYDEASNEMRVTIQNTNG